jgi:hypothetical protein
MTTIFKSITAFALIASLTISMWTTIGEKTSAQEVRTVEECYYIGDVSESTAEARDNGTHPMAVFQAIYESSESRFVDLFIQLASVIYQNPEATPEQVYNTVLENCLGEVA